MKKLWYAVQHGDNYDWDNGSYSYQEAVDMAADLAEDDVFDGEEIRIVTINEETNYCEEEEIFRAGTRG